MKRVRDLGEFELISRIGVRIDPAAGPEVLLGVGDDAAILRPRSGEDLVISNDSLVEGVHFRWANQAPHTIGQRALRVAVSDLAAMGARPVACTLALSLPPALELRRFDGFVRGFTAAAQAFACPLVGGNLSRARQTSAVVTVLGAVARGRALRRDRARAGDRVFVTGCLGAAALARARSESSGAGLRHLPAPRLEAGRALARMRGRVSCIDVSDGLVADLGHLLEASGVGAAIDASQIPRPPGFASACQRLGLDPEPTCLAGGEDYELLFTLPGSPRRPIRVGELGRRLGVAVTEIGSLTRQPGLRGIPHVEAARGWRHF